MEPFNRIYERAVARKGEETLLGWLPKPRSDLGLKRLSGAKYLSEMSRAVFRSGFVWKIVDYKWPTMAEALHGFDPVACAFQPDEAIEALLGDERVIRHLKKLRSVRENAMFVLEVERQQKSFGKYLADWPVDDIIGLHADLKKRGSRLGGRTGQFFLRGVGKDTFCLTRDVVGALIRQKVVDRNPTAKRDLAAVQAAFNEWREQSGRPLCEISRILSCSIDG
ncbi:MAG: DNA-3-methyladenine glycosylase I [Chromatiales bacterium]|nr:MAG: DNA-3-methyladenine glycosylase I [Chromatiales bacterium]